MIAVKRLKAYKKAAPFLHLKNQGGGKGGGRGSSRGGGGGGGGGIRLGFGRLFGGGDDDDGPGASSSMAFTSGTLSSSEMGMSKSMSSSFNASMTASMDQAGSSSDLMSKSGTFLSKSGSMTASGMGSSGVFAGKKKRRQQAARAAAVSACHPFGNVLQIHRVIDRDIVAENGYGLWLFLVPEQEALPPFQCRTSA